MEISSHPVPLFVDGDSTRLLVQSGILDGDAGCQRERLDHGLVVLGELVGADLVGEVDIAVDRSPDPDRGTEERCHRRMTGRETDARRVVADHFDPGGMRVVHEHAEDTLTCWKRAPQQGCFLVGVEPRHDELGDLLAGVVEDAEGPVAGVRQGEGLLDDMAEQRVQVQVGLE